MTRLRVLSLLGALAVLGLAVPNLWGAPYTAYSLRAARQRIERAGENWRWKEPEVLNLGGINKVEGFVWDGATGDLILVGQKEAGRAALTLDDLVVALRARFIHGKWPLVSIDPTADTEKTQMQHVRFEGGIEDTAFGQALFDADYRLKEIGMGLQATGVAGLRTAWERNVEEFENRATIEQRQISSRFWFYPISPHVVVRAGVCVIRGLRVGVFTEVLAAKIDGRPVADTKGFKFMLNDAWASDVSDRFGQLCQAQPSFNRLRGLQELVAASKALEDLEERSDLSWWLEKYLLARSETPKQAKVLRRRHEEGRGRMEVSGGVRLTALAMRLNAGDVRALRQAVLQVRPSEDALSWRFVVGEWLIPVGTGQVTPDSIADLFAQGQFLHQQKRYADAVLVYEEVLRLDARFGDAWHNKGAALGQMGLWKDALDCFDAALKIAPLDADMWANRGGALKELKRSEEALRSVDRALSINHCLTEAWCNRGGALVQLKRWDEALRSYDRALEINPHHPEALADKGWALSEAGRGEEALEWFDAALKVSPWDTLTWSNKGEALTRLGRWRDAVRCFDEALRIDPSNAVAWSNRGVALEDLGRWEEAVQSHDRALGIDPRGAEFWVQKGVTLGGRGRYSEALGCYDRALEIDPRFTEAWRSKGVVLSRLGRIAEAERAFEKAAELRDADAHRLLKVSKRKEH
jgi:tetratricopeptide (TPR) repeat protein